MFIERAIMAVCDVWLPTSVANPTTLWRLSDEVSEEAMKLGAYDYITNSDDIKDRLLNTVKNIRDNFCFQKLVLIRRMHASFKPAGHVNMYDLIGKSRRRPE